MPLSPCCPYHPAGMSCRLGQHAPCHVAFVRREKTRLPDLSFFSRPPLGSLSLRPGDLLTIPKMALSVGFIRFVSSTDATQAKGLLTFTPVGLPPTEHVCLSWTHSPPKMKTTLMSNRAIAGRMLPEESDMNCLLVEIAPRRD